jgi:BirA family biotin operon repressor/biotin-[acetyl-CoA-carboxylase] ligase
VDGTAATIRTVQAALGDRAASIDVECVAETGSTNTDLLAWARTATEPRRPRLRVASRQTAGRGRNGRAWQSADAASLTFSLGWPLATSELRGLSLAVGVAIADGIDADRSTPPRIGLKWPNDLWLMDSDGNGRKLGGVLIETTPAPRGRVAIVGVGINVVAQQFVEVSSGVAALRELDPRATPLSALERVAPALIAALERFEREGFAAFAADFARRDLLRGRAVRCSVGADAVVDGVATGVLATGELLVRSAAGMVTIGSGEVSVRLADFEARAPGRATARSAC